MARFKTILTNAGASALARAMYHGDIVFPDYALAGRGIFDGEQATVTDLVEPVAVDIRVMDRELIEADGNEPCKLKIAVQTFNSGITEVTPVREILLYANSNAGADMANAIPFAYAWLYGDDTDNILAPPLNPGQFDTIHFHELAIFVTNQEVAHIEVSFSFNGFVTHRLLNEIMEELLNKMSEFEDAIDGLSGSNAKGPFPTVAAIPQPIVMGAIYLVGTAPGPYEMHIVVDGVLKQVGSTDINIDALLPSFVGDALAWNS